MISPINPESSKISPFENPLTIPLTLLCGSIGLKLGKSIGRNDRDSEEVIWLGAIIVSLLFVASISYLQKYTVYKVLERKRNSVE